MKGYFLNLKKFLDKFPKKEIRKNAFQNRVLEMELKSDAGNEDKVSTEIQIKQIIKDHLNEILSKKEEKPQSFIKEENKKEDLSDESYNFTHESNELINNYFISALLTDYALELKGLHLASFLIFFLMQLLFKLISLQIQ